ncbi:SRPBCC domain-containing protein [Streptomyces sp. NPDC014894]|uniref:SRPBCC domain-containing protein n=1 Tax=Streptomyces sp. NPDC014894 TaxID=3364931 RepID=UPI0036FC157C
MNHEVFVPVPAETVRQVLRDPARVARCVHGLQQDADGGAGPLSGRLKIRAGGHSITYRGSLRLLERDGGFTAEGEGSEARGGGTVTVALTIRPDAVDGGTTLSFTGSARAGGRLAELSAEARDEAAHRLLDRFGERLAAEAVREIDAAEPADSAGSGQPAGSAGPPASGASGVSDDSAEPAGPPASDASDASGDSAASAEPGSEGPGPVSSEDAERLGIVGEPAPGGDGADTAKGTAEGTTRPVPEDAFDDILAAEIGTEGGVNGSSGADAARAGTAAADGRPDDADDVSDADDLAAELDDLDELDDLSGIPDELPAEAAHARRTMIGRSAEEVDHAPPRGRYAPVPAPDATAAGLSLRWIAPAAALAVASAVVVGRALRRRR